MMQHFGGPLTADAGRCGDTSAREAGTSSAHARSASLPAPPPSSAPGPPPLFTTRTASCGSLAPPAPQPRSGSARTAVAQTKGAQRLREARRGKAAPSPSAAPLSQPRVSSYRHEDLLFSLHLFYYLLGYAA